MQEAVGRRDGQWEAVGKIVPQGYRDLKVYQLAYRLAMEIFKRYSLTDQIRRSSRSVG